MRNLSILGLILLSACGGSDLRNKQAVAIAYSNPAISLDAASDMVGLPEVGLPEIGLNETAQPMDTLGTHNMEMRAKSDPLSHEASIASLVLSQVKNKAQRSEALPSLELETLATSFSMPADTRNLQAFDTKITGFSIGEELEPKL